MGFAAEFNRISQSEARAHAARFIHDEIRNWRGTRKHIASKRWLWELLQNAKDASKGRPFWFKAKWSPSTLTITHNAGYFRMPELVALVEGDSSKHRRGETTGRFGK